MRRGRRRRGAALAALGGLAAFALSATGLLDGFESDVGLPVLYAMRGPQQAPDLAAVLALDLAGIEALRFSAGGVGPPIGRAPACLSPRARLRMQTARNVEDLPRELHACLLDALREAGAAGAVYDIHFSEIGDAAGDAVLAEAMRAGPPTLLLERIELDEAAGAAIRRGPSSALRAAAAGGGFFLIEHREGDVLRFVTAIAGQPEARPVTYAALDMAGFAPASPAEPWAKGLALSRDLFRFYGPPGAVATVPLETALAGGGRELLAGRMVFIGASDPDGREARDVFETPFAGADGLRHSGVELIATAFLNATEGGGLRRLTLTREAALVGALAFATLLGAAMLSGLAGAGAALLIGVAALGGSLAAFHAGWWAPATAVALLLAPAAAAGRLIAGFARQRGVIGRVLPRTARVDDAADALSAARTRRAAVMFLDVAGSTTLAERMTAADYTTALNRVFAMTERAVDAAGGEIVKFTGDGLMAVFERRPRDPEGDESRRAIIAARAATAAVEAAAAEGPMPSVRLGVEAGEIAIGYVGGRRRGTLDAMGDAVNVAARLQELARSLFPGAQAVALIGDRAAAEAGEAGGALESCGRHALRGRRGEVLVRRVKS